MKVLITGATGLVGREITRICNENNISVNYLTTNKRKVISEENYRGFYWNPSSGEIDLDCFEGVSAIINLAGASISKRWTAAYKEEILQSRLNSLKTLHKGIRSINSTNINSFVSASAIGIYPDSVTHFYEEDVTAVDDSFLGDVVKQWELEIDSFKGYGFLVAKVRIGLVLSANGGALPEIAKPIKFYAGAALGSGRQWQSWIHNTDLARLFLFVIKRELEGIYNGVAPNPVTNAKMVKEIAGVLQKPLLLRNIPKFVLKSALGDMAYLLFASQRVSSKKIEEKGFVFNHLNIRSALEQIYLGTKIEEPMNTLGD